MAKIQYIKDKENVTVYPVTHERAVRDSNGVLLETKLAGKQDSLVSGTNIKTINNESILGSGNITAGDPNAVKYVEQTLTGEQKAQARSNIGAGTSSFSGSYNDLTNKPTIPDNVFVAIFGTTTYNEVMQACLARKIIFAWDTNAEVVEFYPLVQYNDDQNKFYFRNGRGMYSYEYLTLDSNDEWDSSFTSGDYQLKTDKVNSITGYESDTTKYPSTKALYDAIHDLSGPSIIQGVNATVNNTTGTPSVTATYSNSQLSFAFSNIKGETGAAGTNGTNGVDGVTPNITLGTVTTGAPGSQASASITGTAAAPVLNLTIPQGQKGEQGLQGNTGSSVDYAYELVNNLTTDDTTKGLSAKMGNEIRKLLYFYAEQGTLNRVVNTSGAWINTYTGRYVKVPKGAIVILSASGNNSYFTRVRSIDTSQSPNVIGSNRQTISSGSYVRWEATEDCYILWYYSNYAPSSVTVNGIEYVNIDGPTELISDKLRETTDMLVADHYDFTDQGECAVVNSSKQWTTSYKGRYVYIPKGTTISFTARSGGDAYYFLVKRLASSGTVEFASGTGSYIKVSANETATRTVTEDCYAGWYVNGYPIVSVTINGNEYVEALGPIEPKIDRIENNIESGFDSINSDIASINTTINSSIYLDRETGTINKYMGDSGWSASSGTSRYVRVLQGDLINVVSNNNYTSQISFVEDYTAATPTFINGWSGRRSCQALSLTSNSDGYILVLISAGSADYTPSVFTINGRSYVNGADGRTASQFLSDEIDEIKAQNNEAYSNDLSKYFLKGNAPKSFPSSKKICIIAAGQSNIDGRVPASSMPASISAAMPLTNCHYVKNSASGAFSSLDLSSSNWAFDLVTYYNLVTRANKEIYVIKWSLGGTAIDPTGDDGSQTHSYWTADYEQLPSLDKSLLYKFENSIRNHIASDGDNFEIRAFLWHQGEADRASLKTGCELKYLENLRKLIAYVRGVVGNAKLPVILGTVSWRSSQSDIMVNESIKKIAEEDPYVFLVNMDNATLLDSYHFDAASSQYFGEKAYDALIDAGVISGTKINPTAPWDS